MRPIKRQAIVGIPNHLVFDVVNNVARYPEWFSWCADAEVLQQTAEHLSARLQIKLAGVQLSFSTENELQRPTRMTMKLRDGALKALRGEWHFEPLGLSGTRVHLQLDLDFSSSLVGAAVAIAAESWANSIMDDFLRVAKLEAKKKVVNS